MVDKKGRNRYYSDRSIEEKISIALIISGIIICFVGFFLFCWKNFEFNINTKVNAELFNQFGGFIGGVVGAIWSLAGVLLFYNALRDQKNEFKFQSNEIKKSNETMFKQASILQRQQFESTFFSLIQIHQRISDSLKSNYTSISDELSNSTGRAYNAPPPNDITIAHNFIDLVKQLNRFFHIQKNRLATEQRDIKEKDEIEIIQKTYDVFNETSTLIISNYFKNLYHIVKYIDNTDYVEKSYYVSILRAQFSKEELVLLFYNGLSTIGHNKMKPYIEKYHLLKGIAKENLLSPSHFGLYNRNAYASIK